MKAAAAFGSSRPGPCRDIFRYSFSAGSLNSVNPAPTSVLYHAKHFLMSETCTRSRSYSGSTSANAAFSFSGDSLGLIASLPPVGVDPGENVGQRNVLAFGEHRNLRKGAHLGIRRGIHAPSVEQRLDDHAAHGLRHEFIKSGLARNGQNLFQFHKIAISLFKWVVRIPPPLRREPYIPEAAYRRAHCMP